MGSRIAPTCVLAKTPHADEAQTASSAASRVPFPRREENQKTGGGEEKVVTTEMSIGRAGHAAAKRSASSGGSLKRLGLGLWSLAAGKVADRSGTHAGAGKTPVRDSAAAGLELCTDPSTPCP